MTPKFEVGEVVILQSPAKPHLNGEYSVVDVAQSRCVYCGELYRGFVYKLDGVEGELVAEPSLKKKHQPGTLSFRDLMQTLKDPSKCKNA